MYVYSLRTKIDFFFAGRKNDFWGISVNNAVYNGRIGDFPQIRPHK